jgi:hypothetical protein
MYVLFNTGDLVGRLVAGTHPLWSSFNPGRKHLGSRRQLRTTSTSGADSQQWHSTNEGTGLGNRSSADTSLTLTLSLRCCHGLITPTATTYRILISCCTSALHTRHLTRQRGATKWAPAACTGLVRSRRAGCGGGGCTGTQQRLARVRPHPPSLPLPPARAVFETVTREGWLHQIAYVDGDVVGMDGKCRAVCMMHAPALVPPGHRHSEAAWMTLSLGAGCTGGCFLSLATLALLNRFL